jgi:hypothetical protein
VSVERSAIKTSKLVSKRIGTGNMGKKNINVGSIEDIKGLGCDLELLWKKMCRIVEKHIILD